MHDKMTYRAQFGLSFILYKNMPSPSIRIDEHALGVLRQATDSYRLEKFLEEANAAFAALGSDPEAWGKEQQEWGSLGPDHRRRAGAGMSLAGLRRFQSRPADLVVVLLVTSAAKGIPCHIAVSPPQAGVRQPGFIKCEDVAAVEDRLRILMGP
jgi:hypothetical protein